MKDKAKIRQCDRLAAQYEGLHDEQSAQIEANHAHHKHSVAIPEMHACIPIAFRTGVDFYAEPTHPLGVEGYYKEATIRFVVNGAEMSIVGIVPSGLRILGRHLIAFAEEMESKEVEAM